MTDLIHDFIFESARRQPQAEALVFHQRRLDYATLAAAVESAANALLERGVTRGSRVAVYLDKCPEAVIAIFGASAAGAVFVPVNPLLKPEQVAYILSNCNVAILITSVERSRLLGPVLGQCRYLKSVFVVGAEQSNEVRSVERPVLTAGQHATSPYQSQEPEPLIEGASSLLPISWEHACANAKPTVRHRVIDADMAAILYTSGSTGKPKGVVLSHRNMVAGAASVVTYLDTTAADRILAVLPLSFDYGLSQLTTAFRVGACAVLINYLLPRDILNIVQSERITCLAAVPPLWIQIAQLPWQGTCTLRTLTNSGGAMPRVTLDQLRKALPAAKMYLMYGLTEAFRSTYLSPDELDRRPDSIGKAIPNAEILVLRKDGTSCEANEPGELVHRGALVSMGYWNDPSKSAERFKPIPSRYHALSFVEIAVWSGDTVRFDEEGFLYFISRNDEMIKSSGYRISPTEIEEVIYRSADVIEAAAIGVPHPILGQSIVVVVIAHPGVKIDIEALMTICRKDLPGYMLPARILARDGDMPRNPNGKIDRKLLSAELEGIFSEPA